jgi:hypothetical protein
LPTLARFLGLLVLLAGKEFGVDPERFSFSFSWKTGRMANPDKMFYRLIPEERSFSEDLGTQIPEVRG